MSDKESRRQTLLDRIEELRELEKSGVFSSDAIADIEKELLREYLRSIGSSAEMESASMDKLPEPSKTKNLTPPAPTVFICYARKDNDNRDPQKRWLDRLQEYLGAMQLQEQIAVWSDERIAIGDRWDEEIKAALATAKAVVLMVSPAFLASRYIRDREIPTVASVGTHSALRRDGDPIHTDSQQMFREDKAKLAFHSYDWY